MPNSILLDHRSRDLFVPWRVPRHFHLGPGTKPVPAPWAAVPRFFLICAIRPPPPLEREGRACFRAPSCQAADQFARRSGLCKPGWPTFNEPMGLILRRRPGGGKADLRLATPNRSTGAIFLDDSTECGKQATPAETAGRRRAARIRKSTRILDRTWNIRQDFKGLAPLLRGWAAPDAPISWRSLDVDYFPIPL